MHRFEGLCKNPQDGLKTLVEVSLHPLPSDGERNGCASYQSNRAGGGSAPGPRLRPLARPRAWVLCVAVERAHREMHIKKCPYYTLSKGLTGRFV